MSSAYDDYIINVIRASLLDSGNQKKLNKTENVSISILSETMDCVLHTKLRQSVKTSSLCQPSPAMMVNTEKPDKGPPPYREMDTIQFIIPGNCTKEH